MQLSCYYGVNYMGVENRQAMYERALGLGMEPREFERRPAERIVVTGFALLTPLGGTEKTWQGLLEGRSGVRHFDVGNYRVGIAAPVEFNPADYFEGKELKTVETRMAPLTAMGIAVTREAGVNAGLLENGRLHPGINKRRVGLAMGSTIGSMTRIIRTYQSIHETDEEGRTGKHIHPFASLQTLPEQLVGRTAEYLGFSGWGLHTQHACATGLANIVEGAEAIKAGRADIVFAGGFELPFSDFPEVAIGMLARLRGVLSTRNDEPEKASRPFDRERDGFVIGEGGVMVVLEALEHARTRGAEIYAELLGFCNSVDGFNPTAMDTKNVAQTIALALWDERIQALHDDIDLIVTHATSTQVGDPKEIEALRLIFGDDALRKIPITAPKGNLGHTEGAAGAINAAVAINAIREGIIPHIINLEEPEKGLENLNFVRGRPLKRPVKKAQADAYGFGGINSVAVFGKI